MLIVEELEKVFADPVRGDVRAVGGVSFRVEAGAIYGLLGPNGAGKTTILRCIVGLLEPTAGEIRLELAGGACAPAAIRARLGFLAAGAALPERLTCRETLRFFGLIYGIAGDQLAERIERSLRDYGLLEYAEQPTSRLSTGYRQRLSLARALLHEPDVLLLDEATSGLDPLVARTVREQIRRASEGGRAVIFSTHIMSEAEALCDRVGILAAGRLLAEGTPDELRRTTGTPDLESAFVALAEGANDAALSA